MNHKPPKFSVNAELDDLATANLKIEHLERWQKVLIDRLNRGDRSTKSLLISLSLAVGALIILSLRMHLLS